MVPVTAALALTLIGVGGTEVAPGLKPQYLDESIFGIEYELMEDLKVGMSVQSRALKRVIEDVSTDGAATYIIANPGESVSANDITKQQNTCNTLQSQFDSAEMDDPKRDVYARELNRCNFLADAFTKVGTLFNKPVQNYDAWSVRVNKRFAKNWVFQGSYTYSRLNDNQFDQGNYYSSSPGLQNNYTVIEGSPYYNPDQEYGRSLLDSPHKIVIAPTVNLPFGEGHKWAQTGVADMLLGGWSVTAVATFQSGFPIGVSQNENTASFLFGG